MDTLDVSWIDVSELDSLSECFKYCRAKYIVGLEKWDVSNVRDMHDMFSYCTNLESIGDINEWNLSICETIEGMFSYCYKLNTIGDISGWDVSNVENMKYMFDECTSLKNVGNLERWKLPANTFTRGMFVNSAIKPIPSWYHE